MNRFTSVLIFIFSSFLSFAQNNELVLSPDEAEKRLVENNWLLLAEKYEIDIAEAEIMQARLFENPVISVDHNIYNRHSGRYFDFGAEGQTEVEIEQALPLFGQRGKRIRMEKFNRDLAIHGFSEALRETRKEMYDYFLSLYFALQSEKVLDRQIESVSRLLDAYTLQYEKGNIPLMEKSRLQALLLSLQKEKNDMTDEILNYQGELRLLLGVQGAVQLIPDLSESFIRSMDLSAVSFSQLTTQLSVRPDMLSAAAGTRQAEAAVSWEKSQAMPEFSIRGMYDRAGGIFDHYFAAGISISVPIFNRNQGGIRAARATRIQQNYRQQYIQEQAQNQLYTAYAKAEKAYRLYESADYSLLDDFDKFLQGVESNYRKRNISLLEFIDYYESYKEASLQLYEIRRDYFLAWQELLSVVNVSPLSSIQ